LLVRGVKIQSKIKSRVFEEKGCREMFSSARCWLAEFITTHTGKLLADAEKSIIEREERDGCCCVVLVLGCC